MSRQQLVEQLHQLGVRPGSVLVVHSSYRAIRPVEGGPDGVLDALLEAIGPYKEILPGRWTISPEIGPSAGRALPNRRRSNGTGSGNGSRIRLVV